MISQICVCMNVFLPLCFFHLLSKLQWITWMQFSMDLCVFSPPSLTQEHMVSVILVASRMRPYLSFVDDWYAHALGFLLVKYGWNLGINLVVLRRTHTSVKQPNKCLHYREIKVLYWMIVVLSIITGLRYSCNQCNAF